MAELPTVHSNMQAFEDAKAAAHAPKDAATGAGKAIALFLILLVSAVLVVAGYFADGFLGAFIGLIIAVGIIGIGGTAVWMAENSHRREAEARKKAARDRARRRAADADHRDAATPDTANPPA
jgi:hypothetical protein